MQDVLRTAWRCALLDKNAYSGLHFDDYATANAVMLVAGIAVLEAVVVAFRSGVSSIVFLVLSLVIQSLVGWAISTGVLWLAATKLFNGSGRFDQALRMTGYAWLPFAILAFAALNVLIIYSDNFSVLILVALGWYGAGLYTIGKVLFELESRNAAAAAILGAAGWLVVRLLLL